MTRISKMFEILEEYISLRQNIYGAIQAQNSPLVAELNARKHLLINVLFSYLSIREHDHFQTNIQKIISGVSEGCKSQDMKNYISLGHKQPYFSCLEKQKNDIKNFIEENLVKSVTLIETDDGFIICNGEFYHGVCHEYL